MTTEPLTRALVWRNAKCVGPIALVQGVAYFTLNHFPLFEARALPLTWIDRAMPFWLWTIWPYLVMISAPVALPLVIRQEAIFRQALWAYVPAVGLTLACHGFWPTRIDRPNPSSDATFSTWAYRMMLELDTPHSCFPSGHVVGPMILCWAFWRDGWRSGPWLLALFALLSLTIMTTKQHYFWDLLAGYLVAGLGIGFSFARLRWSARADPHEK